MIKKVVYLSRQQKALTRDRLESLLSRAQQKNREKSLTGFLVYDQTRFFQYLEGPVESINDVMGSVRRDSRHSIIVEASILGETRLYENWDMRILTLFELSDWISDNELEDLIHFSNRSEDLLNNWIPRSWKIVEDISKIRKKL